MRREAERHAAFAGGLSMGRVKAVSPLALCPAPYTNRGELVRLRRGATTESSRGLQPTVEDPTGWRRGATLEWLADEAAQASLPDADSRLGQPWAEAHGYRHPVAPRHRSQAIRVRSRLCQLCHRTPHKAGSLRAPKKLPCDGGGWVIC